MSPFACWVTFCSLPIWWIVLLHISEQRVNAGETLGTCDGRDCSVCSCLPAKGARGAPGKLGEQEPQGPDGIRGSAGPHGEKGRRGFEGPPGL
ncbi:collagen alpha-4(IV) chain-like [Salvelinus sp. IW2-2015]|uniref:collagen alpha-4(IV) chain-like n=1 Tax=Salvelinus sp. IW2-2015 TaxID=2691554 RepID=UPI000CDFE488|nr:collagen alpha-4(IV) chain-like [Salvelinus alpinus]XP_023866203.1 collagen alpha-4(IV) chain-like [Salvelinus alpinus]